jgi:ATP-binding cassette subfamily C protein CydCD
MKPLDPRLLRYASAARSFLVASVLFGITSALLLVVQAGLVAHVVVQVVAGDSSWTSLRTTFVTLTFVLFGRGFLLWLSAFVANRSAAVAKSELRRQVVQRLVDDGPQAMAHHRAGALAVLISSGVDALDQYFSRYLSQLLLASIVPFLLIGRMAVADWLSALTIVLTIPLVPVFMILVGKLTQGKVDSQFRALTLLSGHFLDLVRGLPTLRLFNRADVQVRGISDSAEQLRRVTMANLRIAFLSSFVLELVTTFGVALVAVSAGLRLVNGEMTFESALVVLLLAPEVYAPLRQVGAQFHANAEGVAAAEMMFAILDEPAVTNEATASGGGVAPIRFENVSVQYEGRNNPALTSVSFEVRRGRTVVLTGPSGVGKSTLLAALMGFVGITDGFITVDGCPLDDVDLAWWRSQIAWVPQRTHVFADSVAANVRIGRMDATDDEVLRALRSVGLGAYVASLSDGIYTELTERGENISAGERQRLGLARAFVRNAPVVLLDEPLANLDAESEFGIATALADLLRDRTAIIVTHRLNTLKVLADDVVDVSQYVAMKVA